MDGRRSSQIPVVARTMEGTGRTPREVIVPVIATVCRWLATPVVEDFGIDRPFRLRRISLLLLAGGWATFLVSCLLGLYLVRQGVRLHNAADLLTGVTSAGEYCALQWACRLTEALGAASFFAGLGSVTFFDKRDRIPVWRCE
jgi:hypothetical protein